MVTNCLKNKPCPLNIKHTFLVPKQHYWVVFSVVTNKKTKCNMLIFSLYMEGCNLDGGGTVVIVFNWCVIFAEKFIRGEER